jgi:hypothetical protein
MNITSTLGLEELDISYNRYTFETINDFKKKAIKLLKKASLQWLSIDFGENIREIKDKNDEEYH